MKKRPQVLGMKVKGDYALASEETCSAVTGPMRKRYWCEENDQEKEKDSA